MNPKKYLITDIDNTIFDWVSYYVPALWEMLSFLSEKTSIPIDILLKESRDVFTRCGSIEYPFLVQELASICDLYGENIEKMLTEVVDPCRELFLKKAENGLNPYSGVKETLEQLKHEGVLVIALTDAPRYVAMWKLNKLGLLEYFDAVYGLGDPKLPLSEDGAVKVAPSILKKHLGANNFGFNGAVRTLPDSYEKPGVRGLRTILMDYNLEEKDRKEQVLWCGDHLTKDMELGRKVGIDRAWASYGAKTCSEYKEKLLLFSPIENIQKNANLVEEQFSDRHNNLAKNFTTLKKFSDLIPLFSDDGSDKNEYII